MKDKVYFMESKEYKKLYDNISANIRNELEVRISTINKELEEAEFKHLGVRKKIENSKQEISDINKELSRRIADLKNIHEWEKYTIAFFGETNAGKSTVIEALRIILKENTKARRYEEFYKKIKDKNEFEVEIYKIEDKIGYYNKKSKFLYFIHLFFLNRKLKPLKKKEEEILKNLAELRDGEIIGTGKQDFTQSCIDYNFSHDNKKYTLIDVPGIEGDEGKYERMILNAISRAHTVFYVVSSKIPESGTIEKIKKYLKEQAEVYCIINERKHKYFPEDAQKSFQELHYNQRFTEEVNQKMGEVLGDFYKGSLTIQALLAFYGASKTIPYSQNEKYIKVRKNLLDIFEEEEILIQKSNIEDIKELILNELDSKDTKIYNINLDKIIACIDFFETKIKKIREENYSNEFIEEVNKQVVNVNNSISKTVNSLLCNLKVSEGSVVTNTFRVCEDEIYDYIDHNRIEKDSFRQFCDFTIKKNIEQTLENYKREVERCVRIETDRINNELKRLGDRVNSLQTSFSSMDISNQIKIEIPTIGIKEVLDFTLSVASLAFSGAAIGTFFPIVGNILGAIIGGILGLIIQGIKALFGGESKESKIKRKVSEGLRELKSEVTQKISGVKNKIVSQFEQEIV